MLDVITEMNYKIIITQYIWIKQEFMVYLRNPVFQAYQLSHLISAKRHQY